MKKALGWASTEKQWPMAANVTISGRYIKKRVEAWWKNWVSKNIAIALREPDRSTSHIHLRSSEIACPREGRLQSRIAAPKQRDSLSLWREAQHNSWGQPMPNRCLTDANQAYKLLMSRAENEKKKKQNRKRARERQHLWESEAHRQRCPETATSKSILRILSMALFKKRTNNFKLVTCKSREMMDAHWSTCQLQHFRSKSGVKDHLKQTSKVQTAWCPNVLRDSCYPLPESTVVVHQIAGKHVPCSELWMFLILCLIEWFSYSGLERHL